MVAGLAALRRCAIAGWIGASCGLGLGLAEAVACEARVELAVQQAFVGEQVQHEIVFVGVARDARIEWLAPPDFPDMRVASLPPPMPGTRSDRFERRERRALWPARPGTVTLPPARFRCTPAANATHDPDVADREGEGATGESSSVYSTPPATLQVVPAPTAGRPASWRGLVGEVALTLQANATQVRVGEPIELRAVASGRGHMQQARIEWPRRELEAQAPAPELFDRPPQLFEQPGAEMLGRRSAVLDVVPRAPGRLRVPPVSVAWLDPRTGSFESTTSTALEIDVLPTSSAVHAGEAPDAAPAKIPPRSNAWKLALGVGVAVVGAWLVAAARRAATKTR